MAERELEGAACGGRKRACGSAKLFHAERFSALIHTSSSSSSSFPPSFPRSSPRHKMLLCDFASVKRQIGHCESAAEREREREISVRRGREEEEEEGKSWYFMGERFIWNTEREGEREGDKGGLCRTLFHSFVTRTRSALN